MATSKQGKLDVAMTKKPKGPVECLGGTFESDEARRAHFIDLLRQKLRHPAFRRTRGFPQATDDDILRMSDPPYYTACPNPFIADFVRVYGKPYNPNEAYHRDPFAVDTSVGKTDALYKAHSYHTKVPHLGIVPSILHYTEPGDIVLDGFAGSGMTGVAAQFCGTAPAAYRGEIETEWKNEGRAKPKWGARRVVLNDLGPAATFITANYNLPFDVDAFAQAAQRLLDEVEAEIGWMYETHHTDKKKTKGRINFTVWSEVFTCPDCAGEVVFLEEALDPETKKVKDSFPCPGCGAELSKSRMERFYETRLDPIIGESVRAPKRRPVIIDYSVEGTRHQKTPDAADLERLARISAMPLPAEVPTQKLPYMHMTHERARMDTAGITHIHHFFLARAAHALAALWRRAAAANDRRIRNMLVWFVEQTVLGLTVQNRYSPTHFSQVNRNQNGVYYVPSQHSEVSPWYILDGKLSRLVSAFAGSGVSLPGCAVITTGDCSSLPMPDASVDYIFTDPPFGENIYYADLNFLVEAWHHVLTDATPEAIVDKAKQKGLFEYQGLMRACFEEYARVLRPNADRLARN